MHIHYYMFPSVQRTLPLDTDNVPSSATRFGPTSSLVAQLSDIARYRQVVRLRLGYRPPLIPAKQYHCLH